MVVLRCDTTSSLINVGRGGGGVQNAIIHPRYHLRRNEVPGTSTQFQRYFPNGTSRASNE